MSAVYNPAEFHTHRPNQISLQNYDSGKLHKLTVHGFEWIWIRLKLLFNASRQKLQGEKCIQVQLAGRCKSHDIIQEPKNSKSNHLNSDWFHGNLFTWQNFTVA